MKSNILLNFWAEMRAVLHKLTAEKSSARLCKKASYDADSTEEVALQLRQMLLDIYRPQVAFSLRVTNSRPKSLMGYYSPDKQCITVHGGWGDVHSLEEIAIHEYAHHIHFTEHRRSGSKDAVHGRNFWRIYSALMAKAIAKGVYNDNYIDKIVLQEDEK